MSARATSSFVIGLVLVVVCLGGQLGAQDSPLRTLDPRGLDRPNAVTALPQDATMSGVRRTITELMATTLAPTDPEAAKAVDIPIERFGPSLKHLFLGSTIGSSAMSVDLTFVGAMGTGVPDTMGAVGPTQYLVVLNSVVRSFSKDTGTQDGVLNLSLQQFFSGTGFTACCDPKVRFDRLSGRWIVGAMSGDQRRVLLAVSSGGVLTANSAWTFFSFQQDQIPPAGDTGCTVDYIRMSVDAYAVYFVFGMFSPDGTPCATNPTSSTAFVIRKTSVLGSGPLVATAFRGTGYFQVPADQFESGSNVGYITTSFSPIKSGSYYRVFDPGGTPSLSAEVVYSGVPNPGARSFTLQVRHKGNALESGVPDDTSGRMFLGNGTSHSVPFRRDHLWVGDLWGVDNQGKVTQNQNGSSTATRNGLSFVELRDVERGSPSVVQAGVLFAATAANDFNQRNYWMPALIVNGQGHMVLAGSAAGTSEYINAAIGVRLATDPPGTLRSPLLYTNATAAYNGPTDPKRGLTRRWGDYSNVSVDPSDDMTMWAIQQFTASADVWGVMVSRIKAPPPPSQWSFTPRQIPRNSPSVSITVTGTPTDGEGFFDPGADPGGPGFSNHLSARVGGGVIVNSVSFVDATHVTLNVSTVGVPSGPKPVTIINPDGQSVTGTAVLTVADEGSLLAPSGRTASVSGSNVALAWTAPTAGSVPTAYTIEAGSEPGLANLASFSTGSTATTFATAGVANGTYYLRVRATNNFGISEPSNEVVLIVGSGCSGPPGAPAGLVILGNGGGMVSLRWSASSGIATTYVVEAGTRPGLSDLVNSDLGSASTVLTASGVGPGSYYVRVRGKNACGLGASSNELFLVVQ